MTYTRPSLYLTHINTYMRAHVQTQTHTCASKQATAAGLQQAVVTERSANRLCCERGSCRRSGGELLKQIVASPPPCPCMYVPRPSSLSLTHQYVQQHSDPRGWFWSRSPPWVVLGCSFSSAVFVQFRGLCFSGVSLHANQSRRPAACFLLHGYTSAGF